MPICTITQSKLRSRALPDCLDFQGLEPTCLAASQLTDKLLIQLKSKYQIGTINHKETEQKINK